MKSPSARHHVVAETIIDKIWRQHLVAELPDGTSLIYVDRVLLHERMGSIALTGLADAGRRVRSPGQALAFIDHIVDTRPERTDETLVPGGTAFIQSTRAAAREAGMRLFDVDDPRQGIVHVVSPEIGLAQPGLTIACPDSHTCTQGGVGALAWGIGSSEAEHALATQTLALVKPKTMRVTFDGGLAQGVTAKDMILHLIAHHGAAGGGGFAVEFAGAAIEQLPIEGRLTLCNMAVEFAAWTGLCAPDQKTIDYLAGRPLAPAGAAWDRATADWLALRSDPGAVFNHEIQLDADRIAPMITWGTSPQHAVAIDGCVPDPNRLADPKQRQAAHAALKYMDLQPGTPLLGVPIQTAFIGSCTNGRLSDLRAAATVLKGRRIAAGVRGIVVPGSMQVRVAAEAEGLDRIFTEAGFEWRKPGCSMCFFAGGEHLGEGLRAVSTTNRNFENRQGPRTRSHLASPAIVAASAVAGHISDARRLEN